MSRMIRRPKIAGRYPAAPFMIIGPNCHDERELANPQGSAAADWMPVGLKGLLSQSQFSPCCMDDEGDLMAVREQP